MKTNESSDKAIFGFWIYLMSDLVIFAVLFATYAVLRTNTFGGPTGMQLFSLPNALAETLILLTSSFTCGLAMLSAYKKNTKNTLIFFGVTFILGALFLGLELTEFSQLIASGNGPDRSAFLSAFFTLVGTHGLHIATGLLWMAVAMVQIKVKGLSDHVMSKLIRLGIFWHFLDVVWIFIFTIVYLMSHAL